MTAKTTKMELVKNTKGDASMTYKKLGFQEGLELAKQNLEKQKTPITSYTSRIKCREYLAPIYSPLLHRIIDYNKRYNVGLKNISDLVGTTNRSLSVIFTYLKSYKNTRADMLLKVSALFKLKLVLKHKFNNPDPGLIDIEKDLVARYKDIPIDELNLKIIKEQLLYLSRKEELNQKIKNIIKITSLERYDSNTISTLQAAAQYFCYYLALEDIHGDKIPAYSVKHFSFGKHPLETKSVMQYLNYNYLQDGFYEYNNDISEWEMEDDVKEDVVIDEETINEQYQPEPIVPEEDIAESINVPEPEVVVANVIEKRDVTVKLEVNGIKLEIPAKLEGDEIKLSINLSLKV